MKLNYFKEPASEVKLFSISRIITHKLSVLSPMLSAYIGKKLLLKNNGTRHYANDCIQAEKELKLKTSFGVAHVNLFGKGKKVIVVSHGWADTSSCFSSLVKNLKKQGYTIAAVDHIGHGKSSGNTSHLLSFINTLELLIDRLNEDKLKVHGIIGHSMGALATFNLPQEHLKNKKIILISSPINFFELLFEKVEQLGISENLLKRVLESLAGQAGITWQQLAMKNSCSKLKLDISFIHDRFDRYAPFQEVNSFLNQEKNTLFITEGLGHRRILGDTEVIEYITKVLASR